MFRIALFALAVSLCSAQTPSAAAPPQDVDHALRARVQEFYGYHVSEQYRKAEKLVAEDAQDTYYSMAKAKYESFDIDSIEYRDNFTKAKVTCWTSQYLHGLGFDGKPAKTPSISWWKLVNGSWFWYVDPEELAKGPFGKMANAGTKAAGPVPEMKVATSADFVFGQVKLDKNAVIVKPNGEAEIMIGNGSAGTVTVQLYQVLPGIKVTLEKTSLNSGEKTVAKLKGDDNPHTGQMAFRIDPTGEVLWYDVKRQ